MVNTSLEPRLPPELEKQASAMRYLSRGANALKGALIGYSDDALRASGKLKGIRKHVTRTGFSVPDWNKAVNIGATTADDAGRLLRPSVIPGKSLVQGGMTEAVKTPGSWLDSKLNPLGWYTGGSSGFNVMKSRFQQGGIFGKGGLAHGTFAVNPRLGYNFRDLKAGRRLLPNFSSPGDSLWQRFDTGSILGTAGRGTAEVFKKGIGVGVPAAAFYGALNPEEGDERGLGQRLGGALGSTVGTYASWPLGAMSWLPSTLAPIVTDNKTILGAAEAITPWALGEYAGEVAGSLGNRKKYDPAQVQNSKMQRAYEQELLRRSLLQQNNLNTMSVGAPALPAGLRHLRGPYGTSVMVTPGMLQNSIGHRAGLSSVQKYMPPNGQQYRSLPPLPTGLNYQ